MNTLPPWNHKAVRVVDIWWLPVEIRSGGWSTTALTGTKPEYGDTACEFGALSAGTYTIIPQGLDASVTVTIDEGGFALVEFAPLGAGVESRYNTSAEVMV